MFITFEGCEGCGKTTQSQRLKERLVDMRHQVVHVREPGGTEAGDRIRTLLLHEVETPLTAETEVMLFAAARAQLVRQVIRPALKEGKVVLRDRFVDSSYAYQGMARGVGYEAVKAANALAVDGTMPDLTFLLDLDVEVGLKRAAGAFAPDRFESEAVRFHQQVREGFLALAGVYEQRYVVLNAEREKDDVTEAIWEEVQQRLGDRT